MEYLTAISSFFHQNHVYRRIKSQSVKLIIDIGEYISWTQQKVCFIIQQECVRSWEQRWVFPAGRFTLRHESVTDLSTLSTFIFIMIIRAVTVLCSDGSATVGLSHLDQLRWNIVGFMRWQQGNWNPWSPRRPATTGPERVTCCTSVITSQHNVAQHRTHESLYWLFCALFCVETPQTVPGPRE